MSEKLRRATHTGELPLADLILPCAVLEDGTRVLSENGITNALLGSRSGSSKRTKRASAEGGAPMPLFLAPSNLKPFIPNDLIAGPLQPIRYLIKTRIYNGFEATILPAVCDVWLKAREAGALQAQQLDKASKAEVLMRGLAHVGIIALVDEATGYQEIRDRLALQEILDKYLRDFKGKWAKTFPDEFYEILFKLKGWQYRPLSVKRPGVVGHWTNDIVYARLAPGVLKELRKRNPTLDSGRRRDRHHQWLTEDYGHPALREHITGVLFLMKASANWPNFYRALNRAVPKYGHTLEIQYPEEENGAEKE